MKPSRRTLLIGGLGMACAPQKSLPMLSGSVLGGDRATRGHAARTVAAPGRPPASVDVAIIGGGIAGLSAAWRLARQGFRGTVALFELDDAVGGTAQGGADRFPWGAHYVTLPNPGATAYRAILRDLGVITHFTSEGRPHFAADAPCFAPQERLYDGVSWVEGLVPHTMHPDDQAQLEAFEATVKAFSAQVGSDGKAVFDIPVANASQDPAYRALATVSFADWLDGQGYTGAAVRWACRYAVRDDFGAEPANVSAWAGLHYHAARRPDPAMGDLGSNILTWPDGNATLVRGLRARCPYPVATGAAVRGLDVEDSLVRVWVETAEGGHEVHAKTVIAAVPSRVVSRWIPVAVVPELSPWRVAALYVDRLPASNGIPFAWDSVRLGGRGLGYVSNAHQTGAFRGPAVLTYYDPLSELTPAEGRTHLLACRWEDEAALVLEDLSPGHPDLREVTTRIDLHPFGHGTTIPAVGLHTTTDWHTAQPHPRVWLAHSDRSGMSLFEEASWHGVRSAEAAMTALGVSLHERLS